MPSLQTQTPRPETKMPPIGNFAPPPSAGKENKKRRGGAGSQITIGSTAPLGQEAGSTINGRNGILQSGNASKVCVHESAHLPGLAFPVSIQTISVESHRAIHSAPSSMPAAHFPLSYGC